MIVDDSKVSRMMIKSMVLDKTPHIDILEAADGQEALTIAEGENIDYFSVDYNMPVMDGIEFIIKASKQHTDSKYVLLTANIQQATHTKAENIGAKCINKPISESSILAMLDFFND